MQFSSDTDVNYAFVENRNQDIYYKIYKTHKLIGNANGAILRASNLIKQIKNEALNHSSSKQ